MEIICFEKKAFEEFAAKIERFIQRVSEMPHLKGMRETNDWLDHYEVCRKLRISKRTLQTLRDNGTLAYTQICHKTYYKPGDVESIVRIVEERRKRAESMGKSI